MNADNVADLTDAECETALKVVHRLAMIQREIYADWPWWKKLFMDFDIDYRKVYSHWSSVITEIKFKS